MYLFSLEEFPKFCFSYCAFLRGCSGISEEASFQRTKENKVGKFVGIFRNVPGYVGVAEEECARVDDVGTDDLHLVGPDVPVGHGLVHHDFGVGVLSRVVIDVFRWNIYYFYQRAELPLIYNFCHPVGGARKIESV